jgi:hypothetical protein
MKVTGHTANKTVVEPDDIAVAQLREGSEHVDLQAMPLADGTTADLELEKFEAFTTGSEVYGFDGRTTSAITGSLPIMYRGHSKADKNQVAFISLSDDNEIYVTVAGREKLTLLAPETRGKSAGKSRRHLLSSGDPDELANFYCPAEMLPENGAQLSNFAEPQTASTETAAATNAREAKLILDVSYSLLNSAFSGNQTAARNYVANLVGAVSTIYQRDINVVLSVKQLVVWTSPDPFGTQSTSNQLTNYRTYNVANRLGTTRNASHLLTYAAGLGGVAYVGTLCNTSYDCGVSNLDGDAVFPVTRYHWDVYVFAHELGHTFGSPHTHCYSPPIDCCYNEPNGCNMCPNVSPQTGTIMSYCHLNGSVTLQFHPRCIDVMQNTISTAGCLNSFTPPVQLATDLSAHWGSGLTDSPKQTVKVGSLGTTYKVQGKLYVQNSGTTANNALLDTVDIYLSGDDNLDTQDPLVLSTKLGAVKPTPAGVLPKYRKLKIKLPFTTSSSGKYLIAVLHSTSDLNVSNNAAVSPAIP